MTGTGPPSVYVRLLGPVRVQRGGQDAGRMTPQQQRFLAVLALSAGKPVGHDVLQRTIWPEEKPASTTSALHGLAHDLRSVLGSQQPADGCGNVLKTGSRYYQLLLAREQVDACEFAGSGIPRAAATPTMT